MLVSTKSYYSFRFGTLSPEEVVEQMAEVGAPALCLADINNTAGMLDFLNACQKQGLQAIGGVECRNGEVPCYTLIARNAQGWEALCRFLTRHSQEGTHFPERPENLPDVEVVYFLTAYPDAPLREDEWLGIRPHQLNRIIGHPQLQNHPKLLALLPVTYGQPESYRTHKLLRAIDQNNLLTRLDTRWMAGPEEYPRVLSAWEERFRVVPQALRNSRQLVARCSLSLELESPKNRLHFTRSAQDDRQLLEKLARDGFAYRYGSGTPHIRKRFEEELQAIDQLGFTAYYLITWDFIRYGMSRGFYHVGRGSGANSIVAYCLKITDVDPIELDLYFERFINPSRTSPPDFDIDFSWDERDEVIEYVFRRYGSDYVALLGTFSTMKMRAAVREVGKALGLPKADIDQLLKAPHETQSHHGLGPQVFRLAEQIQGLPNHFSIHAGGILITEAPLNQYLALQQMPKGFPVAQMDMYIAEDYGFHKYDILSQRGIGHIRDAVKVVRENRGIDIDIHRVEDFKHDPKVIEQLRQAQTIGAFYIESPAMRGLLSKLDCNSYPQLVAASSIIRPGVASSGMMREYIKRSYHPEQVQYLHPLFEQHLGETYGVMVYQEDVMKIAHHFGGLTMAEADLLRRAMSGKKRGRDAFKELKTKFFRLCQEKGHDPELSQEVWRQMESFAGYSFCKAHSASFAVESFQSLYLKAYFPLEFMVAVINNFGGFYRTEAYVHEAKMAGAEVQPPCLNNSRYLTRISGQTIYLGFVHCEKLEARLAESLLKERQQNGPFQSLGDFVERVPCRAQQLDILIAIGAFRFTGKSRQELFWEKHSYLPEKAPQNPLPQLFRPPQAEPQTLPPLTTRHLEATFEQIEILGFPLGNPFELLQERPKGTVLARQLLQYEGKVVRILGYFITRKPTTTKTGQRMGFGTWIDEAGRFFDTTHFPRQLEQFPLRGWGCYLIEGKVDVDFGFASLEVRRLKKLSLMEDPRV